MGISGGELVVLLILIFLLVGPEKLPELAQQLGRLTRELKKLATGAKEKVKEELGPEFQDLAAFDPRQYDPRRIVREAFMDDPRPAAPARSAAARRPTSRPASPGDPQAAAPPGLSTLAAGAAGAAGFPPSSDADVVPPAGDMAQAADPSAAPAADPNAVPADTPNS
ncbi:MAG: twin-arginine translocase TatA/TatE family subunit, partial [Georgenia sp.]